MSLDGNRICLFVSGSSSRLDVFRQVAVSFDVCWKDCPFERFVGLNSAAGEASVGGFEPVPAPVSEWRTELLAQIRRLPPQFEHVLLFLDDFLILSPVDTERLKMLFENALRRQIEYLRLVPVRRAALPRLARRMLRKSAADTEPVPTRSPYYSSLQAALWKRSHLVDTLELQGGHIWDFEHTEIPGHPHFAIIGNSPIHYVHVIEKGGWQPYSRNSFHTLNLPFDPGERTVWGPRASLALWVQRLKFEIIGYSAVRLRRHLRRQRGGTSMQ